MDVKFLDFTAKLHHFEDINPSFAAGWMRVCYHGKNRNNSIIPKETLDAAIPTMFNCPIVANYYRDTDSIGAHDVELVIDDNKAKVVAATQPVGVVPTNDMAYWEEVEEDDGTKHEYLYTPILLWKRQEAFEHIAKAGVVDESMECIFDETHTDKDTGLPVVDKLTFEAFCLLESARPCFESASINLMDSNFKEQFSLMARDWKDLCGKENFTLTNFMEQGGAEMDNEVVLAEQENVVDENEQVVEQECDNVNAQNDEVEIDIGLENGEAEEVNDEVVVNENQEEQDAGQEEQAEQEPECANQEFMLCGKKRQKCEEALPSTVTCDAEGACIASVDYCLIDFD